MSSDFLDVLSCISFRLFLPILALTLCLPIDGMATGQFYYFQFILHGDARSLKLIVSGTISNLPPYAERKIHLNSFLLYRRRESNPGHLREVHYSIASSAFRLLTRPTLTVCLASSSTSRTCSCACTRRKTRTRSRSTSTSSSFSGSRSSRLRSRPLKDPS